MIFLFRIGHPLLFIPWETMRNTQVKESFSRKWVEFEVDAPSIGRIRLPFNVFEGYEMKKFKGG